MADLPPKLTEPVLELLETNLDRKFASALPPACKNFSNQRVDLAPFPAGESEANLSASRAQNSALQLKATM
jgi:hypothetical protein